MSANFQTKRTTLTFSAQICPKWNLGLEIQKTNLGIRISILEVPYVCQFSDKKNFDFLGPNLSKMDFGVGISKI